MRACARCGGDGARFRCSRCHRVYYCSERCKAADWRARHGRECVPSAGRCGEIMEGVESKPRACVADCPRGKCLARPLSEWTQAEELGSGGYGTVSRFVYAEPPAKKPAPQTPPVAVKALDADALRPSLMGEMRLMALAAHPNVQKICEVGVVADKIALVSELMPMSLDDYLREQRRLGLRLSDDELIVLIYQLIHAYAFLAGRLVAHRDVKARNVLVERATDPVSGAGLLRPIVIDFGLTRWQMRTYSADAADLREDASDLDNLMLRLCEDDEDDDLLDLVYLRPPSVAQEYLRGEASLRLFGSRKLAGYGGRTAREVVSSVEVLPPINEIGIPVAPAAALAGLRQCEAELAPVSWTDERRESARGLASGALVIGLSSYRPRSGILRALDLCWRYSRAAAPASAGAPPSPNIFYYFSSRTFPYALEDASAGAVASALGVFDFDVSRPSTADFLQQTTPDEADAAWALAIAASLDGELRDELGRRPSELARVAAAPPRSFAERCAAAMSRFASDNPQLPGAGALLRSVTTC